MGAAVRREYGDEFAVVIVMGISVDNRPAGLFIDTFCPIDLRKWFSRDERSGNAIEDVIEPVLVRLHDDFSRPAVDPHICKHKSLDAVVVPGIATRVLVIP